MYFYYNLQSLHTMPLTQWKIQKKNKNKNTDDNVEKKMDTKWIEEQSILLETSHGKS